MDAVLVDGRPEQAIPASDRGLHYGDGLFETIAVFDGRPCLWGAHLARLTEGCARLGIPMPDPQLIAHEARALCGAVDRGVLKIIVTRGSGGRGYRPPGMGHPRRILSLHAWPDYPEAWWERGVRLRWCRTPLGLNPVLAGLKHCNRLEQVMARAEWDDPDIAEGLMCDADGQVVAGTMSNLFLLRDRQLYTPSLDRCGIAGVARDLVLAVARQLGIAVHVGRIAREQVATADALLLTHSLIGVWPVAECDGRSLAPGCWPRDLIERTMEQLRAA